MKFGNLLFAIVISVSLFNCVDDSSPNGPGIPVVPEGPGIPDLPKHSIKFKVPNATNSSSAYFQLNNDNTQIFNLDDHMSATFSVDSEDLIQLVANDELKLTLRIADGLDVLRHLHVWLSDQNYNSNCPPLKELRGKIDPSPDYLVGDVQVTNMSTGLQPSAVLTTVGSYKNYSMCFSGPTLHYKYVLDDQSKKIELKVAVSQDPDTRIDVYLSDEDPGDML